MSTEKHEYDYTKITAGTIDLMRSALEGRNEHGPGSLVAQALTRLNAECRLKTVTECAIELAEHLRKYQLSSPSTYERLLNQYRTAYMRTSPAEIKEGKEYIDGPA